MDKFHKNYLLIVIIILLLIHVISCERVLEVDKLTLERIRGGEGIISQETEILCSINDNGKIVVLSGRMDTNGKIEYLNTQCAFKDKEDKDVISMGEGILINNQLKPIKEDRVFVYYYPGDKRISFVTINGSTVDNTTYLRDDRLEEKRAGNYWRNIGATHVIMGKINILDYEIESGEGPMPLAFKITKDGYTYLRGSGTVTDFKTKQTYKINPPKKDK